jgi:tetratricopeptide (TPR) repeat protein
LLTLLQTEPPEQHQLLGQFFLDLGLYSLALKQFARLAPDSPYGPIAAAYAGYTRWQAGEERAGLQQIASLVTAYPTSPQIRLLLVLMLLQEQDFEATRRHLDTLTRQYPDMPDVYVARAQWAMRQHDYAGALRGYQKALSLVEHSFERRGQYALLAARFHLATTYELCRHGVSSAELAARMRPDDGQAWATLAAIRYQCRYSGGAVAAARVALERGGGADARYYLGAALLELGHYDTAREMLIQAADMAPASVWRQRAEDKLAWLLAEQ